MKKRLDIHGKDIAQIEADVPKEYLAVTSRLSRGYLAFQDLCLRLITCGVQQRQ